MLPRAQCWVAALPATLAAGILASCVISSTSPRDTSPPPPDPKPPFQSLGFKRLPLTLQVREYLQDNAPRLQPSLVMGNKSLGVLTNNGLGVDKNTEGRVQVIEDGNSRMTIHFIAPGGKRLVRESEEFLKKHGAEQLRLTTDEQAREITCKAPYVAPDGSLAYASYTLKPLDTGRAEISWDSGSKYPMQVTLSNTNDYCDKVIEFDGKKWTGAPLDQIKARKNVAQTFQAETFSYEQKSLPLGFTIGGLGGGKINVHEGVQPLQGDNFWPVFNASLAPSPKGKLVVDLGETEVFNASPTPPVNGLDFFKNSAIHVPLPATRNELPNPSFEEDLHFWLWTPGWEGLIQEEPVYSLSSDALFGKKALLIRNHNQETFTIASFPMSVLPKQDYTVSFYAKAAKGDSATVRLWISSARRDDGTLGNTAYGDGHGKGDAVGSFKVGKEWTRFSRTFTPGSGGLRVYLNAKPGSEVLVDGMQLERGKTPTEFVCDPLEGNFTTSAAPDNDVRSDSPVDAGITFTGKPGTTGIVDVEIQNAFRETVYAETLKTTIGPDGTSQAKLSPAVEKLGLGVFIVKMTYRLPEREDYVKYGRYSVMAPLDNTHPTRTIIGANIDGYLRYSPRPWAYGRKLKEWGFGSTSWAPLSPIKTPSLSWRIMKANNIVNVHYAFQSPLAREYFLKESFSPEFQKDVEVMGKGGNFFFASNFLYAKLTPADEAAVERAAYEYAKGMDPASALAVSWGNEEQSCPMMASGRFDDYFLLQRAVVKGAKRAHPQFQGTYSSGVCNMLDPNLAITDGWLTAADKAGFKYDALTAHAYGGYDGGFYSAYDLDVQIAKLFKIFEKHGYGKDVPFYLAECANNRQMWIPEWNTLNGDTYHQGFPSYSWGHYEYLEAATTLRVWIVALKYWPRFYSTNFWQSTVFMDHHLTPTFVCAAANTFGHLLPWAEFKADIRPTKNVRGYAFQVKDGSGVAPLWCNDMKVELGMRENPRFRVKLSQPVEFVDMMGNPRAVGLDADGYYEFALTPAPLFLKAADAGKLADDLNAGQLLSKDDAQNVAVKFNVGKDGGVMAVFKNQVAAPQKGALTINGSDFAFDLPPQGEQSVTLPGLDRGCASDKMYSRSIDYILKTDKKTVPGKWDMAYFFVPECDGMPDWNKIPAHPVGNVDYEAGPNSKALPAKDDFRATYKLAWDKENLYLRVEVADARFHFNPQLWTNPASFDHLWDADGCLEVYFDCFADGRSAEIKGRYEDDDCRFDFAMPPDGKSGRGLVNRWHSVEENLGGGVGVWPTKEQFNRSVLNQWERTRTGYTYTITLNRRYILPLLLREGSCAGFAVYIHSVDDSNRETHRAITSGLVPGEHCQLKPANWPVMVLKR